jgi:hypothetical protein
MAREFLEDFVELCVAVPCRAPGSGTEELRGARFEFIDSLALPALIGQGNDQVFQGDLVATPVAVRPCEACAVAGNAEGLKEFEAGALMFVFAGFSEFVRVNCLADVVNGGAEADQVGVEVRFGEFGRNALDQSAGGVVDNNQMGEETRRRGDLLKDVQCFGRQRLVLAGGERVRLSHPCRMRVLIECGELRLDLSQR